MSPPDNSAGQPIRVLLVDDDAMVRQGLRWMLEATGRISVVADVADGDEVLAAIDGHHPDVILLDVRMARQDGITTVAVVKRLPNPPKIIMLTTFDADQVAYRAIDAGADGFLLKTASPDQIVHGIRDVVAGHAAVSPKTAGQLITRVRQDRLSPERADARRLVAGLTDRERDVLTRVGRGLTNAEIARDLYVSETTVKTYVAGAFDKLGVEQPRVGGGHRRPSRPRLAATARAGLV